MLNYDDGYRLLRQLSKMYNHANGTPAGRVVSVLYRYMDSTESTYKHNLSDDGLKIKSQGTGDRLVVRSFKKWATWLKPTLETAGYNTDWTSEQIEAASTLWGTLFSPRSYTFEVVREDDLIEAYRTGPKSCMSGDGHEEQLVWYVKNNVQLVKISTPEDGYMGRALLWTALDGRRVLDRVYPSDGGQHCRAVRTWAKEQGWITRNNDSAGESYFRNHEGVDCVPIVSLPDPSGHTPYIDSMNYTHVKRDGSAEASPANKWGAVGTIYQTSWHGGGEPWMTTDRYGTRAAMWEMVDTLEGRVHPSNLSRMVQMPDGQYADPNSFFYCAVTGVKDHFTNMESIFVGSSRVLVSQAALVPREEQPARSSTTLLRRSAVEITAGLAQGLLAAESATRRDEQGRVWLSDEWHDLSEWINLGRDAEYLEFYVDDARAGGPWYNASMQTPRGGSIEVAAGVWLYVRGIRQRYALAPASEGTRAELYDRAAAHYAQQHRSPRAEDQAAD